MDDKELETRFWGAIMAGISTMPLVMVSLAITDARFVGEMAMAKMEREHNLKMAESLGIAWQK